LLIQKCTKSWFNLLKEYQNLQTTGQSIFFANFSSWLSIVRIDNHIIQYWRFFKIWNEIHVGNLLCCDFPNPIIHWFFQSNLNRNDRREYFLSKRYHYLISPFGKGVKTKQSQERVWKKKSSTQRSQPASKAKQEVQTNIRFLQRWPVRLEKKKTETGHRF